MKKPLRLAAALGITSLLLAAGCSSSSSSTASSGGLNQASCDSILNGPVAASSGAAGITSAAGSAPAVAASPGPASGDAKSITFVGGAYTSTTQAYWQDLATKFQAANPGYTVKVQIIDWNDIDQQVATMIQTKQYPDILNENKYSGWAADGLLNPAANLVSPTVQSDFIPAFKAAGEYQGVQYGLPFITSTRALFYNKDAFAKAGIAAAPTTWKELVTDAQALTKAGYIGYGMPLGTEESQAEWSIWSWGNGGNWKVGNDWTINSPQNVQALNMMNCLANVYKVTEANPGQTNRTDGVFHPFADGKVGMMAGASFAPSLFKGWNSKVNYGVAPLTTNAGVKPFTLGVQDYLMSFKKPGNTAAVNKFLNFFYQPANYTKFLTSQGFLPATASASAKLKANPDFAPFLKLLPTARFYPSTDPAFTKVQGAVQNQIGTGVAVGANTQGVLDAIQAASKP
jgi:multiple sugar transport system substrate-binding protein